MSTIKMSDVAMFTATIGGSWANIQRGARILARTIETGMSVTEYVKGVNAIRRDAEPGVGEMDGYQTINNFVIAARDLAAGGCDVLEFKTTAIRDAIGRNVMAAVKGEFGKSKGVKGAKRSDTLPTVVTILAKLDQSNELDVLNELAGYRASFAAPLSESDNEGAKGAKGAKGDGDAETISVTADFVSIVNQAIAIMNGLTPGAVPAEELVRIKAAAARFNAAATKTFA